MTSERQQAVGRADIVAKHILGVFVFEVKVDESADAALAQIEEKGYCAPYLNGTAPVYAVGVNFNGGTRNIDGFKVLKQGGGQSPWECCLVAGEARWGTVPVGMLLGSGLFCDPFAIR